MDEAVKRCSTCHRVQPSSEFNKRSAASDGLQARCRSCSREWYLANLAEHKANVRARNVRVRAEHIEHLAAYLLEHPCVECGEDDVRVLEFDHEDPADKVDHVTRLVGSAMAWSRIEAEIAKCSVRCANCHRRRTAEMFGFWRQRVQDERSDARRVQAGARLASLALTVR